MENLEECPKIPTSIGTKIFFFQLSMKNYTWGEGAVLVKKETNGKYTELNPVIRYSVRTMTWHAVLYDDESRIFECGINQQDVDKMHGKLISGKVKEYIPDLYLKNSKRFYYPYIVYINKEDITNNEKYVISLHHSYAIDKLIGFHPFKRNKNPPENFVVGTSFRNVLSKFYFLYQNEINLDTFENLLNIYNNKGSVDIYDDLEFYTAFINIKTKKNKIQTIKDILNKFKPFKWKSYNQWGKYIQNERDNFFENAVKLLFFEISKNEIFSKNLNEEEKYTINKLFITHDFDNYTYLNNEQLLASKLITLEDKEDFYELYYDLLIDNDIYIKDFKYKNYFREDFKSKIFEKYLRYEFNRMSYKTFDFVEETKNEEVTYWYSPIKRKKYTTFNSLRKTKNGEYIYYESINEECSKYIKFYFFINDERLDDTYEKNELLQNATSTSSLNDEQLIITKIKSNKPIIIDIRKKNISKDKKQVIEKTKKTDEKKNSNDNNIIFDSFYENCYDAIKLNNSLIVVSGETSIGYYYEVTKNNYKLIHSYKYKEKKLRLVYLIEFSDNFLISCFFENYKDKTYIGFHKIDFNKNEKIIKDENELIVYGIIRLCYRCLTNKNVLAKLTKSFVCVGGEYHLHLINVENKDLVKSIKILDDDSYFCSFFLGDHNTIFICYGYSEKTIFNDNIFDKKIGFKAYRFDENLEFEGLWRPSKKSREKEETIKCLIF